MGNRLRPDLASEARYARHLAEALMRAVSDEAGRHRLSDACVVGALTLLLGKVTGRVARHRGFELDRYAPFIVEHFTRIAKSEFARSATPLQ